MRAVIQRVKSAAVDIVDIPSPYRSGEIGSGLLVLVAVENSDSDADAKWLASKTAALRIFEDSAGKMNLSLKDVGADALVVSQFTLYGDVRKGNRPSFNRSAHPEISVPLYEKFCKYLELELGKKIQRGACHYYYRFIIYCIKFLY